MAGTGFSILLVPILKTVLLALLVGFIVETLICCTGLFVVRPGTGSQEWPDRFERRGAEDRERPEEGADVRRARSGARACR